MYAYARIQCVVYALLNISYNFQVLYEYIYIVLRKYLMFSLKELFGGCVRL